MTKLIQCFWVAVMLAASQFASPVFAGNALVLGIIVQVVTVPTPAVQPVVIGDFTYTITCTKATFATPAATITFTAANGTTPASMYGFANPNTITGAPNDCTYSQASRPAAPAGFSWVGTPPDVFKTGLSFDVPTVIFSNTLTQTFTITTVASPPAGGMVFCNANPVPSGQTSSCAATANSGYTFVGFSTSSCGAASTNNPFTTSALAADCTVTGAFTLTPVNGVCGGANGVATGTAPAANLCGAGTASAVTSATSQFTWTCTGNATGSTANCAAPRTYMVTASVSGGNGTITPTSTQTVASGAQPVFTLAPGTGYSATVGGTCNGALVGNTYTTNAVAADCTVIASFTLIPVNGVCGSANAVATGMAPSANLCSAGTASAVTSSASQFTWSCAGLGSGTTASCAAPRTYTVTSSVSAGNGTITPTSTQAVASGAQPVFTMAPSAGYSATVSGTCNGALVGNTYTTNAVVADCTVIASFTLIPVNGVCGSANAVATGTAPSANLCSAGTASAVTSSASQFTWSCAGLGSGTTASCAAPRTYTVTPSVNGAANGTIAPATVQTVASGATPAFTVTPATGYSASVAGSCGGTFSGNTYTVTAVSANCMVIVTFAANTFAITTVASPAVGGTLVCTPNPVPFGATSSCTATPSTGYVLAPFVASASAPGSVKAISPAAGGISGCGGAGSSTSAYVTGPITSACTVTANFVLISVPLTTISIAANGGTVNCSPNPVPFGSAATCTAAANAGFTLTSISGCGGATTTASPFVTGAVVAACTVSAVFAPVAVPVVSVPVPTLSGWASLMLIVLTVGVAMLGFSVRSRQR